MQTDAPFFRLMQQRFDLLLHREILRLRIRYQLSLDEFRGLYISDEQVDALLRRALEEAVASASGVLREVGVIDDGHEADISDITLFSEQAEHLAQAAEGMMPPRWARLRRTYRLSAVDMEILQLAILMDLDSKYEVLFGYLNNDVSRRYPTVDMALRLLDGDRDRLLAALMPQAVLFNNGLLTTVTTQGQSTGLLSGGFRLVAVVMAYLLDLSYDDPELDGLLTAIPVDATELVGSSTGMEVGAGWDETDDELYRLIHCFPSYCSSIDLPVTVLEGQVGSGRGVLAAQLCAIVRMDCLRVRLDSLGMDSSALNTFIARLHLQLQLRGSGIAFELAQVDAMSPALFELHRLFNSPAWRGIPVFLLVLPGSNWRGLVAGRIYLNHALTEPNDAERRELWREACGRHQLAIDAGLLDEISGQFLLTPRQIEEAVGSLSLLEQDQVVTRYQLYRVARQHSMHDLDKLAQKVVNRYRWEDLVLPPHTERNVRELIAAIRNRHRVYGEWNMGWRSGNAQGLIALFSGASGTGKTITASVIANEIGFDLYRIDLSAVVSKYIGETEKNLDRIFDAARRANVILFLDECDSLMGKRSEVKDAHDRYANIEVSYLLQKMELHQGVVIAATNFAKNMDQAFSRRMQYVIEFARPSEMERERLWRSMFPPGAPLAEDINFQFLADQFELPGGDIRTIALDAAFLAAQDGQTINMQHLVNATARQLIKQGQAPRTTEFKQYQGLVRMGRG